MYLETAYDLFIGQLFSAFRSMTSIDLKNVAFKSSQKLIALMQGGLTDFFPSLAALIPLNLFAAVFPHNHDEATMRVLHAYTSIGLMVIVVACLYLFVAIRSSLHRAMILPLLLFSAIYSVSNTTIVITGMGVENGGFYHFVEAIILTLGYCLTVKYKTPLADSSN